MKQNRIISLLPWLALGCGCVGGGLWAAMDRLCREDGGLLIPWNLPLILLAVLSLAVCAVILRHTPGEDAPYPAVSSRLASLAGLALAGSIVWMLLAVAPQREDTLAGAHRVLGYLSAGCLCLAAMTRWQGKNPGLLHGVVCVFFCLHLAERYRVWSSDPQMGDYLWQLLACVGLTLTAYHSTARDVGMGRRRRHTAIALITAFFSMTCLFTGDSGWFYLTGGLWAAAEAMLPPVSEDSSGEGAAL